MPSLSRCRPMSRVADSGPKAKVSHHLMLSLPSLRLCLPMCGLNLEPNLRSVLCPANHSSNPGPLMSRGRPHKGPADDHLLPEPRGQPQQVGFAEVLPERVRNLSGPRPSEPRVQPQQLGLADDPRQPMLQQMAAPPQAWPQQVGLAEVLPGRVRNLPVPRSSAASTAASSELQPYSGLIPDSRS